MSELLESLSVNLVSLLVPAMFFAVVVLIVYFSVQAHSRRRRYEHEERMSAIEKGVPIPPTPERYHREYNPYKWPFVLIGIGVALLLGVMFSGEGEDVGWVAVPFFIGIGLLLAHRLRSREKKGKEALDQAGVGESSALDENDEGLG